MMWNWQQPGWPQFSYDSIGLQPLERDFLLRAGECIGVIRHLGAEERDIVRIELLGEEALQTSAIEGEILDRDSVQSSLRRQFGLANDGRRVAPAEDGVVAMMVDLYRTFAAPLTHDALFAWHRMLMAGAGHLREVGAYRTHADAMQVVSGRLDKPRIHYEAPPSAVMSAEMDAFVVWFNATAPGGATPLPALTRAGLAHLYFVSIHPFEDGNGRIGRALAEKSLAQNLGQPTLIALADTIAGARKAYYAALERNNKELEITDWLSYFAKTVLDAQHNTLRRVEFYVAKARLYDRLRGQLNERQDKVIARMFRAGLDGFKGGLSAENYISIAKTSRATATRDLQDLVAKGGLTKTGVLRHTRYRLNMPRIEQPAA